jgi:hypothetical protein
MKTIIVGLFALFATATAREITVSADECPHDLEVRCIDDINKAYPICDKAAKEKGKDFPADIDCMKFLLSVEKDCWPCICLVADVNKWHVKGCN